MKEIREDEMQRKVIALDKGYHLVLAPAGCGKTHILAERVRRAIESGKKPEDMLCLTFTNRASRGMRERIAETIEEDLSGLFIGNIHRFCSKFLYERNIASQTGCILDEDDTLSVINQISKFICEEEDVDDVVSLDFEKMKRLNAVLQLQHLMSQYRLGHPKEVFLSNESDFADADRTERFFSPKTFQEACMAAGLPVSLPSILEIYDDSTRGEKNYPLPPRFDNLTALMETARKYEEYKQRENLLDFDDLLILTYDFAINNPGEIPHYSWIQIDEVQDLNSLQFAIVDAFTEKDNVTVWLGDEQQAIFSFTGAKLNTLEKLKPRTDGNIHHLNKCYRSPKYLLDIFNDYAAGQLDTDPDFLPDTDKQVEPSGEELLLYYSRNSDAAYKDAVKIAEKFGDGKTAVLVPRNADAEKISDFLGKTKHIKLSGTDLFAKKQMKLLLAHLNVVNNDINYMAWARLLSMLKIFPKQAKSREFVGRLKKCGMLPSDFLLYPGSSYLLEFVKAFKEKTVVIFDTETTGLNVFEDDIVQIAATKYDKGKATERLNIFLETEKEIPERLGDLVNPLVEEYKAQPHLKREEGLKQFIDFARDAVIIGHNVEYDYNILHYNCLRDLPETDVKENFSEVFDTLKLARLVRPGLRSYKLKDLLEVLNLEGENSHLADADIEATHSLAVYCMERGDQLKPEIMKILEEEKTVADQLWKIYAPLYFRTLNNLYKRRLKRETALVKELRYAYSYLKWKKIIRPLPKIKYIFRFLRRQIIDKKTAPSLYEQMGRHLMELNTFREADLCSSDVMDEKIVIATVHKAKGLEFDNVIVYGCVDDIYPFFYSKNDMEARKEDARKLYVAMTRAKKRLCLLAFNEKGAYSKKWRKTFYFPAQLSPFLSGLVGRHPFVTVNGGR